jgi:hypothetical protein
MKIRFNRACPQPEEELPPIVTSLPCLMIMNAILVCMNAKLGKFPVNKPDFIFHHNSEPTFKID